MSKKNSYKRAWGSVVEKWKDEAASHKAWRDADSSMIPEYVAPKRRSYPKVRSFDYEEWKQLQRSKRA